MSQANFKHLWKKNEQLLQQAETEIVSTEFTPDKAKEQLKLLQSLMQRVRHGSAFVSCLTAQNVNDTKAIQWGGKVSAQNTALQNLWTIFEQGLLALTEEDWSVFIEQPVLEEVAFHLGEKRQMAKEKLSPTEEKLAGQLAIDGYHAWGNTYNQAVGRMKIPFEDNGEKKLLSAGQLHNRLSHASRSVRQRAFQASEEAWQKESELYASTLNHLAGFRLNLYQARGWEDVLKEPLAINRMKKETLDAMWDTITKNKPKFYEFMAKKAELLGLIDCQSTMSMRRSQLRKRLQSAMMTLAK